MSERFHCLTERSRDPELSLEGVVLAGAICAESRSATALAAAGGGAALVALLRLRQADDEHVLQTVFAFRQMLSHPSAAECLVSNTGVCSESIVIAPALSRRQARAVHDCVRVPTDALAPDR